MGRFGSEQTVIEAIMRNDAIADDRPVRFDFLNTSLPAIEERLGIPGKSLGSMLVSVLQAGRLEIFSDWIAQVVSPQDLGAIMTESDPPINIDAPTSNLRTASSDKILPHILRDDVLRNQYMSRIDDAVAGESRDFCREIDIQKDADGELLFVPVLVVGGGPLTSLIARMVGPYADVTVVTQSDKISGPWRNRRWIYLNSSTKNNKNGSRLPLLDNNTTPITPSRMANVMQSDSLLDQTALEINSRVRVIGKKTARRKKMYLPGNRLGDVTAHNIYANTKRILTNQSVDARLSRINADGSTVVTMFDETTGRIRRIRAGAVIYATGPGKEVCKIPDRFSQYLYGQAERATNLNIEAAKERTLRGENGKLKLEGIIGLQIFEKLFGYWSDVGELKNEYPFSPIFKTSARVGIIGNGDTANTWAEFLSGKSQASAYPIERSLLELPEVTWFGLPQKTQQAFKQKKRRRYKNAYGDNITSNASKVDNIRRMADGSVLVTDKSGNSQTFDYVFVATGLEKNNLPEKLESCGIPIQLVKDLEGKVVAKGNTKFNNYIVGTAAEINPADFPDEIRNILAAIDVAENTVALWVHTALTSRLIWTLLAQMKLDEERISDMVDRALSGPMDPMLSSTPLSIT